MIDISQDRNVDTLQAKTIDMWCESPHEQAFLKAMPSKIPMRRPRRSLLRAEREVRDRARDQPMMMNAPKDRHPRGTGRKSVLSLSGVGVDCHLHNCTNNRRYEE